MKAEHTFSQSPYTNRVCFGTDFQHTQGIEGAFPSKAQTAVSHSLISADKKNIHRKFNKS